MTHQVLDEIERMLEFHARWPKMLQFFRHAAQFIFEQRLAFGALHGNMSGHRFANIFGALLLILIADVAKRSGLVSMQKRMCLRQVGDIASRAHDGVHHARRRVNADVRFHHGVPVVTLLILVHLQITLAILLLRRHWSGNQGGVISDRLTDHQIALGEVLVDRIEYPARQIFCFEQVTKLEQRRCVWRRLGAQNNPDGSANGLAAVSDKPEHCWSTYICSIRACPIGGSPAPLTF
jgi:hypothetical protein